MKVCMMVLAILCLIGWTLLGIVVYNEESNREAIRGLSGQVEAIAEDVEGLEKQVRVNAEDIEELTEWTEAVEEALEELVDILDEVALLMKVVTVILG